MNCRRSFFTAVVFLIGCLYWNNCSAQYPTNVKIQQLLKTDTTSAGQSLYFPKQAGANATMIKVTIPAGISTGWHQHACAGFAYVVSGTITVEIEGGKEKVFKEGEAFAEVMNLNHIGYNKGTTDVELICIFTCEKDIPFSQKHQQ